MKRGLLPVVAAFKALALGIGKWELLHAFYALLFIYSRSSFRAFSRSTVHERADVSLCAYQTMPHCSYIHSTRTTTLLYMESRDLSNHSTQMTPWSPLIHALGIF